MASTQPLRIVCAAPRSHLFSRSTARLIPTPSACVRSLSTSRHLAQSQEKPSSSPFQFTGPSPPRLPKEEQDLFEALQRQSTGAFSTPRTPPQINQSPDSSPSDRAEASSTIESRTDNIADSAQGNQAQSQFKKDFEKVIEARGKGEELHPNVRRGATPEFEGEVNPKTGEVGGPKNEPLRWGAAGEWSYNGRTTDF